MREEAHTHTIQHSSLCSGSSSNPAAITETERQSFENGADAVWLPQTCLSPFQSHGAPLAKLRGEGMCLRGSRLEFSRHAYRDFTVGLGLSSLVLINLRGRPWDASILETKTLGSIPPSRTSHNQGRNSKFKKKSNRQGGPRWNSTVRKALPSLAPPFLCSRWPCCLCRGHPPLGPLFPKM